jgi:hypothetical protein
MLRVGVLGYVVPLLFGFDTTHEAASGGEATPPAAEASAVAALARTGSSGGAAAAAEGTAKRDTGPAFLGLGTERSNIQVPFFFLAVSGAS